MSVEAIGVERWLTDKLGALSLPVWADTAPDDAPYPFVLFARLDGSDLNGLGRPTGRVKSTFDYAVRVYDETRTWDDLEAHASALDTALQGAKGLDPDGKVLVLSSVRQEPLLDREPVDGVMYAYAGGVYRIEAQEV